MTERRNILFITTDQHRGDCFGFEGRKVKTPHLDQLASQGTRFAGCVTPNLVCQPSRASILTGLLPYTHGVSDNGIDLDPVIGARGFASAFSAAGFDTGYIGKAHFATSHTFSPTGTPECRESTKNYGEGWHGPYMGFEHVELVVEGHNYWPPMKPPYGQHYERWYHQGGRGEALNTLHLTRLPPDTSAPQTWNSALPVAYHSSTWIGNRTIEFLDRSAGKPFCLWASFPDPHAPFDAPEPWSRLHHPDEIDLPAERALDLERRPWWHAASLKGTPQIAERLRKFREESRVPVLNDMQLRTLIANYYGMIALVDHNVGRILDHLEMRGLTGETLVVFSSDHGEWLGDHGLILKGPMAYEGLLRVGLMLSGRDVPKGKVVDDPVSTVDLAATFLDYGGIAIEHPTHSKSLRALIEGEGGSRAFAYSEWDLRASRAGVELDLRTVRTHRHKLTLEMHSGKGELYDIGDDPHEMDNRFDDPGCRVAQKELTDMLHSRPDDIVARRPQVGMA